MKIFNIQPKTWQELQIKCAKIIEDIGFETEVEKNINTVRGVVNIDVFAIDKENYSNQTILIECKNWKTKVPKSVVHSFRSVVSDFGANSGYIVSKVGFQSGSFEAVKNTNVYLMEFDEFQEHFKLRYLNHITSKLQKIGYPLRKYSDWFKGTWHSEVKKLTYEEQKTHQQLSAKYDTISIASIIINYKNVMTGELELEYLDDVIKMQSKKFPKDVKINSYSEYFDWLINFCETGVQEFDTLFGKKLRK
ncbi:hypothetical protein FG167_07300 [Lacinutrix sp. WUR7]|uniref:restriction endonuclease n=1 Tax=Lacinutrix sp. WUR7 TaxID=2653681 RepID=UPI00193E2C14|nr:restriction endonuclease [Lacinutrix sp. WUR7]QRM89050.1 hypothetical protein FG167_07300 [Lacinutrix sp. WUR7]